MLWGKLFITEAHRTGEVKLVLKAEALAPLLTTNDIYVKSASPINFHSAIWTIECLRLIVLLYSIHMHCAMRTLFPPRHLSFFRLTLAKMGLQSFLGQDSLANAPEGPVISLTWCCVPRWAIDAPLISESIGGSEDGAFFWQ